MDMRGTSYSKKTLVGYGLLTAAAAAFTATVFVLINSKRRQKKSLDELLDYLDSRELAPEPQAPVIDRASQPQPSVEPPTEDAGAPFFTKRFITDIDNLNDTIINEYNYDVSERSKKRLLFLDFKNARGVVRGKYVPQHGYIENIPFEYVSPSVRAAKAIDALKEIGKLTDEESDKILVERAKGSANMYYALVLSAPRVISTGKRKPFKARVLTAIVQAHAPRSMSLANTFNPITGEQTNTEIPYDFVTPNKAKIMENYGINETELDLLARILFAEQSVFRYGQCWHSDPLSDGLLCDLQRRAILNALLNRIDEYKARRRIAHLDRRGKQAILTGWVGSRKYSNYKSSLDAISKQSEGYLSNITFILETAMLPSFTSEGIMAVHPWGSWGASNIEESYPDWMLHTSDGGNLETYPIVINYGLYN